MMLDPISVPTPTFMTEELEIFSCAVDRFVQKEFVPRLEEWRGSGELPREIWRKAGGAGLLLASTPVDYGGGGGTLAHEAVIIDRLGRHGAAGLMVTIPNLTVAPLILRFAREEQKRDWLPKLASGEWIAASTMVQAPQAVRLSAVREGDFYLLNGIERCMNLGWIADLVMVAATTDHEAAGPGVSLFIVQADTHGLRRGRRKPIIGNALHGTADLVFDNVRIPAENLLGGEEDKGLEQLMSKQANERLIAVLEGMAMVERALANTIAYVKDRRAFGKAIIEFQNTRFVLADCKTEATIGRVLVNYLIERAIADELDPATSAMGKLWMTETQGRIIDKCLQLHGGYGYLQEYPIAQMYKDARVARIGCGASEIMRVIIGDSL